MLFQVYPNIFCNEIPLPNNPLKKLNSYLVISPERNLIIDTGFNSPECEQAFFAGVNSLNLDLAKTDVLLTHLHSDHTGLAAMLEEKGSRIYAGAHETAAIKRMSDSHSDSWEWFDSLIKIFGLSQYAITPEDHPGWRYRPQSAPDCHPLFAGDALKYGDYLFTVIDIPGHTPGHIGLYEAEHKLFFCGDHILSPITPNITFWGFEQNSLAQYQENLAKVGKMKIDWLFTAHREILRDPAARIEQLLGHHERRLTEILAILANGGKNACQTAALMKWDLNVKDWKDFPKAQKWFAAGEAAAHLEYLFAAGKVDKTVCDGTIYYFKAGLGPS